MPLDKKLFDAQIRGLLVSRGAFVSKDREGEIKRFWFEEFKNCNEQAFVKTITQLKFTGDPQQFPSFQEFKIIYRIVRPRSLEPKKKYCGLCDSGNLILWNSKQDIYLAAECSICVPDTGKAIGRFDPKSLKSMEEDRKGSFLLPERP